MRNIRRDAMDHFKKSRQGGGYFRGRDQGSRRRNQKLTDQYVAQIDKAVDAKSDEILTV